MWKVLRSDLTEFVSTVAGETAEALNAVDAGFPESTSSTAAQLTPAEKEAQRRWGLEETYTTPMLPTPENEAKSTSEQGGEENEDGHEDGAVSEDDEDDEDSSLTEIKAFLASFAIDSRTDEIAALLEAHPTTLQAFFERLVPTDVTYEVFWQRYFYRCDAARIAAAWEAQDAEAQAARAQAVQQGVDTVRNLASGLFGGTGRPPFVMNTAVSEDDLDDEEEEEEELGWDDDEEEEDPDVAESTDSEQIEFRDQVTETLQEELTQALAERDMLQQTVELQHKEIATLKQGESSNDQVQALQTQLFEKESEMAAMQASLLDTSRVEQQGEDSVDPTALEAEVKRLSAKLAKAEAAVMESTSYLEATKKQIETLSVELDISKKAIQETSTKNATRSNEFTALQAKVASLESDNGTLVESLRSAKETEMKLASSEEMLIRTTTELEEVKATLLEVEGRHHELETETRQVEAVSTMDPPMEEEAVIEKAESPETVSSGVGVEPPVVEKLNVSAEEGWDDDW
jgi:hypothetical protein